MICNIFIYNLILLPATIFPLIMVTIDTLKLLLPVTGFPLASVTVIDPTVLVNISVTGLPLASLDYMIY